MDLPVVYLGLRFDNSFVLASEAGCLSSVPLNELSLFTIVFQIPGENQMALFLPISFLI
jgi:hypothetical protein